MARNSLVIKSVWYLPLEVFYLRLERICETLS